MRPGETSLILFPIAHIADDARWIPGHDSVLRHVARDDGSGADQSAYTNDDVGKNCGVAADRGALAHACSMNCPVRLGLELSIVRRRARESVIYESNSMTHEHLIFDLDPLANEAVGRDLTGLADMRVLLDFHERSNLGTCSNAATVKIHQVLVEDDDIFLEDHVGRNRHRHALKAVIEHTRV